MSTTEARRLTAWFDECDGFGQGTDAPHKWVLQADSELRRLDEQVSALTKGWDEYRLKCEDRKDAERYHKLANYMIGTRFDIDDALVAASSIDEISSILDAMQEDKP